MTMANKYFANQVTEETYIDSLVQVRNILNNAYGEDFVTNNPVVLAAGIIAEAIYWHSDNLEERIEELGIDIQNLQISIR